MPSAAREAALARIAAIIRDARPAEDPTQSESYQRFLRDLDGPRKRSATRPQARSKHGAMHRAPDDAEPMSAASASSGAAPANSGDGGAPPRGGDAERDNSGDDGGDGVDLELAFYSQTDVGNAERFRERNRGKLQWCPALGWLAWDSRRWCRDAAGKVKGAAHLVARAIQNEAEALRASGRDVQIDTRNKEPVMMSDRLAGFGRKSEQAPRLSAMAEEAAPYLHVAPEYLDADPFQINVANGTLRIQKNANDADYVRLHPHDPADLITKQSPVVFDPQARCPTFDRFLAEVQPKAEMRRFLMQWQGLSLTGDVSEQKLCFFWGSGKNGKSTFVDVCAFLGGDYSATVPIETFLNEGRSRNAGQATPDLAILPGVRHLRTSEPEKGAKLAEALIKLVTGGEPILARHLNQDYFRFYPQFKLTMSGNHEPAILGTDEGIWRRLKKVPWSVTIPDDKIDPHLSDKLRAEASGILNRLLDGLRDWLDHGLVWPEDVIQATADYRRDSDPCGLFVGECVAAAPGERVRSSDMHELFCAWAKASAAREWSQKGLAAALKDHGLSSKHSNGMWWLDVRLTKSLGDFVDADGKLLKGELATPVDAESDVVPF